MKFAATDNVLLACMASVLLFLDLTDDRVRFMTLAVSKSVRREMKNTFQFQQVMEEVKRMADHKQILAESSKSGRAHN